MHTGVAICGQLAIHTVYVVYLATLSLVMEHNANWQTFSLAKKKILSVLTNTHIIHVIIISIGIC